jgi:hypothetical protein
MQYWARGTDEVKQPKHNTENYKKMSNTDLTNKLGVNPDVHEGVYYTLCILYKTKNGIHKNNKWQKNLPD